jgi:hypothetical protein
VVGFDEVCKFVGDDVLYYEHRCLDEPPAEIHILVYKCRSPAVAIIHDLCRGELYAKFASVLFHSLGGESFLWHVRYTNRAKRRGVYRDARRGLKKGLRTQFRRSQFL